MLPDGRLIGVVVRAEAEHQRRRLYLVPLAAAVDRDQGLGEAITSSGARLLVVRHAALYREALLESTLGADGLPRRIDQLRDLDVFGVKPADLPGGSIYLDYLARDDDDQLDQRLMNAVGDSACCSSWGLGLGEVQVPGGSGWPGLASASAAAPQLPGP